MSSITFFGKHVKRTDSFGTQNVLRKKDGFLRKKGLTKRGRACIMNPVAEVSNAKATRREHSSAGRAHALQAWGHRFEPCCSHHPFGAVVQLVRTPACHAGGRGFKSLPRRQKGRDFITALFYAQVAQLVEQRTENPRVAGSIPALGTTL